MEPSQQSPERVPAIKQPEAVEYGPRQLEYGERSSEQRERLGGAISAMERMPAHAEQTHQPPQATSAPAGTLPAPLADDNTVQQPVATDDTPLIAADEDLIEKEWVDKAKKIIGDTKDDPYRREQEVKKLQIEYVRKRYGREIGDSGD